MMFAQARHGDVAHHHHLVVIGLERDGEVLGRIGAQPGKDLVVHLGDAQRRALQTVAIGILTDRLEDLAYGLLDPALVDAHQELPLSRLSRFGCAYGVRRGSDTSVAAAALARPDPTPV